MIKDSGNRTEFETGAVRDIQEGKGRHDLIPLDVVSYYYAFVCEKNPTFDFGDIYPSIFSCLAMYKETQSNSWLFWALVRFCHVAFANSESMFLEVGIHFEEGAKKYGENNWQKGIPEYCYLNSAIRHLLKYKRGDEDERHDRAFVWNIMCLIWTIFQNEKGDTNGGDGNN